MVWGLNLLCFVWGVHAADTWFCNEYSCWIADLIDLMNKFNTWE
jgi:hypothetical protein